MWLFCKQGFFSAVCHRESKDVILLRARFRGDLERLLDHCGLYKIKKNIMDTPDADYAFRVALMKTQWCEIVEKVAYEIDYENFKDSVHEGNGSARDEAYMGCWMELRRGQYRDSKKK